MQASHEGMVLRLVVGAGWQLLPEPLQGHTVLISHHHADACWTGVATHTAVTEEDETLRRHLGCNLHQQVIAFVGNQLPGCYHVFKRLFEHGRSQPGSSVQV